MISETLKQILLNEKSFKYICENYISTRDLLNAPLSALENIPGIGKSKSKKLKAIMDLSKELLIPDTEDFYVNQPKDAYEFCKCMTLLQEENLKLLSLNTKNKVIHSLTVSIGTLNASLVHPREVFAPAIKSKAASIIIVHNHPSGDPSPSSEDINITTRLKECGKIIGIDLLDHLIIGENRYVSLKEKGVV